MTILITAHTVADDFVAEVSCEQTSRSARLLYSAFAGTYSGEAVDEGVVVERRNGPARSRDEAWSIVGRLADWCADEAEITLPEEGPRS